MPERSCGEQPLKNKTAARRTPTVIMHEKSLFFIVKILGITDLQEPLLLLPQVLPEFLRGQLLPVVQPAVQGRIVP